MINLYVVNQKILLVGLMKLIILFPIFIHIITPNHNTIICNCNS
jgi:hypothetical protein